MLGCSGTGQASSCLVPLQLCGCLFWPACRCWVFAYNYLASVLKRVLPTQGVLHLPEMTAVWEGGPAQRVGGPGSLSLECSGQTRLSLRPPAGSLPSLCSTDGHSWDTAGLIGNFRLILPVTRTGLESGTAEPHGPTGHHLVLTGSFQGCWITQERLRLEVGLRTGSVLEFRGSLRHLEGLV